MDTDDKLRHLFGHLSGGRLEDIADTLMALLRTPEWWEEAWDQQGVAGRSSGAWQDGDTYDAVKAFIRPLLTRTQHEERPQFLCDHEHLRATFFAVAARLEETAAVGQRSAVRLHARPHTYGTPPATLDRPKETSRHQESRGMLPTSPLLHCWLGVALAATLLGCGAPAPVDPLTSGPDTLARGHVVRDPVPTSQPQTGCLRYGDLAADYLWRRDVQHESFAQVFDRLVIALDDVALSPEAQAQLGAAMRLALAVYGHPTWTAADAYAYGLQDCGRTTP